MNVKVKSETNTLRFVTVPYNKRQGYMSTMEESVNVNRLDRYSYPWQ